MRQLPKSQIDVRKYPRDRHRLTSEGIFYDVLTWCIELSLELSEYGGRKGARTVPDVKQLLNSGLERSQYVS